MSEDIVKVVVDYYGAPKKKRSTIDTGLFTPIFKAKNLTDVPSHAYSLNLVCEGKKITT